MYEKEFDQWNDKKKLLEGESIAKFAYPREIWWCSLGLNLGSEVDGRNENFERPIIVMKVYNKESMVVLPLTNKPKNDRFHHMVRTQKGKTWAKLTQTRVISNKRLLRKIASVSEEEFEKLRTVWIQSL